MLSAPLTNSAKLSPDILTSDQQQAITALYEGNRLLVSPMGGGKTIIAASAISELLDDGYLSRVLIVSTPKIVRTVWAQEFAKWQHTAHIDIQSATGTPAQRLAVFNSDAKVIALSFDNLPWAKESGLLAQFDGLLIDETTKLKTSGGAQFKALRPYLKRYKWRAGLTGTPVSENFESLYAQIMLIDAGAALGTRKDTFMRRYFLPIDPKGYRWELLPGADKEILKQIAPLVHVTPDYRASLPPISYENTPLTMPPELTSYYDAMARDMATEDAHAVTSAVLVQKLQQIASGFIYLPDGSPRLLDNYRIDALLQLLQRLPRKVIIVYWYKEDLARLKTALPTAQELTPRNLEQQTQRWNAGEIDYLLIHPRSAGHGLQLEKGGCNLVWFTPQWSNDLWQQTNARIWRQGQTRPVKIYSLCARGTIERFIAQRITDKQEFMEIFNQHLRGQK